MPIDAACHTDRGLRANNEDAAHVDAALGFALLADGLGGPPGGEVASALAVDAAARVLRRALSGAPDPDLAAEALREAFDAAQEEIRRRALATPELRGMGTTLVTVVVTGARYVVAHVGDSRAYLVRAGHATALTSDHSWVQERVAAGLLTPEEARVHAYRNLVTRALGLDASAHPDVGHGALEPGDVVLLTSDGVHGVLSDRLIAELARGRAPEAAARALVEGALGAGGSDNATAAVLRLRREPLNLETRDS